MSLQRGASPGGSSRKRTTPYRRQEYDLSTLLKGIIMVEKNNAGAGAGNQAATQAQHVDAERQRRENNPAGQSNALSNQQPDSATDASMQSACQPTPVQQPDTRVNESHEPGSLSAADVQGGIPGPHASAGRQSN
jgi:hypothetical protein